MVDLTMVSFLALMKYTAPSLPCLLSSPFSPTFVSVRRMTFEE